MRVIATVALAAVLATIANAACSFNGVDLSSVATYNGVVNQVVPENPSLNGNRGWQVNLCSTQAAQAPICASQPISYVFEYETSGSQCDFAANTPSWLGWQSNYGGANQAFSSSDGSRVANVTLLCSQSSTTLTSTGSINAHSSSGGSVWTFDMVFYINLVCGSGPGPNPPGPTSPPGPTAPPGSTFPVTTGPSGNETTKPPEGPAPKEEETTAAGAIIFVVLVFVLPVIYVVSFMLYNYFKLGKRGIRELLPHPEFWRDFPVLCLDGCKFVKNKFMQCIGKGDGTGEYGGSSGDGNYSKV